MASTPSTRRQHDGVAVWSLTDRFRQHYRVHPPHWLISTQVHLVNDGVQNKEESYGKFEEGNKLALTDFAKRVDAPANWLEETLIPRMEAIMRYTIDAAHARLNPKKRQACFELLGFDFMWTLCGNQPPRHRADAGVGRPKFDFYTGWTRTCALI
jgi:hypothetical protein